MVVGIKMSDFRNLLARRGSLVWFNALLVSGGLLTSVAHAAGAPPTAGAIEKLVQPPQAVIPLPADVLTLPEPVNQRSQSAIMIPVSHVVITGNNILPTDTLHPLVEADEGKSSRLGDLQTTVDRITNAYHEAGYPLAYAYIPAQKIEKGILRVAVVEPTYGSIDIKGDSRLYPSVAMSTLGVQPGDVIKEDALMRGLLLLSQTPGVAAHATFMPGEAAATSKLQLDLQDTPLITGDVFVNNAGNPSTGAIQTGFDVKGNDPFGYGSAMTVNALASPWSTARMVSGGLGVDSPYIWDGLRVGAYTSSTAYHLGGNFARLNESGRAVQLGVDSTYPIILAPGKELVARVDIVQNWLGQTPEATHQPSSSSVFLERASLNGTYADPFDGILQGGISLSNGNLSIDPALQKALDALGPKAAGSFQTAVLQVSRDQSLPAEFRLTTSFIGQVASKNLDSSQKFYLGGSDGLGNYSSGDAGGDNGYLISAGLWHGIPVPELPDALNGAAFVRFGSIDVNHSVYSGYNASNTVTEAAIGLKLDYRWDNWSVQGTYAHRIGPASSVASTSANSDKFWFSVNRAFQC